MSDTSTDPENQGTDEDDLPENYSEMDTNGPRDPTDREKIIAEITKILMNLEMVNRTSYSGENHYDTTPHQLTIVMEYQTGEEQIEMLAKSVTSLIKNITRNKVKTSIEHPYRHIIDEDGNQNITDNEHIDKITIRWNERWGTTPADVRGPTGSAIDTDGIPPISLEKIDDLVEKLFGLDKIYQRNKAQRLKENQIEAE